MTKTKDKSDTVYFKGDNWNFRLEFGKKYVGVYIYKRDILGEELRFCLTNKEMRKLVKYVGENLKYV